MYELKKQTDSICSNAENLTELIENITKEKARHGFSKNQAAQKAETMGISRATFFRFVRRENATSPYRDLDCIEIFAAVYNLPEIEKARLVRALICEFINRGLNEY